MARNLWALRKILNKSYKLVSNILMPKSFKIEPSKRKEIIRTTHLFVNQV